MSSASRSTQPMSSTASSDVPHVSYTPSPGEFTPGLEDKFPDFLPPAAFYLAEVMTGEKTPADLIVLKELVETDCGATLTLNWVWVPFNGCKSGALPLDVHEELISSGILSPTGQPLSSSRKREALTSVDEVHRQSNFQPKRSRRIQDQVAARAQHSVSPVASTGTTSEVSGQSEASYLSFTYIPEEGQYKCRRHFHDGRREDYGRTAIVHPDVSPNQDE